MTVDPNAAQQLDDAVEAQHAATTDVFLGRRDPGDLRPLVTTQAAIHETFRDTLDITAEDEAESRIRNYVNFTLDAWQARFIPNADGTIDMQYLPRGRNGAAPTWQAGRYDAERCREMFGYDIAADIRRLVADQGHLDITLMTSDDFPARPEAIS